MCNALDMPTSVWSEMVRERMEPQETRKANDGQRLLADASERRCLKEQSALRLCVSIAKLSDLDSGLARKGLGLMRARAV